MASNINNDDDNNEAVSFQAMMADLSKIETGTSNLPQDRQIELLDTLQTQLSDMFLRLRLQVSARAHQTASGAYPYHGSFQPQGSDWADTNLHDPSSYGSGPSSFGNMSSYSTASTISTGSNSSRRRRPSSPQVTTTTPSVSSASSGSITQFVRAICDSIKSLWQQAEVQGQGNICKTMFYFLKNIVMSFFGGSDNSDTKCHRPSLRYVIPA